MKQEGPNESRHDGRTVALERGLESEIRLVLQEFRQEPGAGAVGRGLFRAEQDAHQPVYGPGGHDLTLMKQSTRKKNKTTQKPAFINRLFYQSTNHIYQQLSLFK